MLICLICFEGTQSNRFYHLGSCRTFSLYLLPLDCLFRIVFTLSYHFLGLYQKLTLAHSNWSSRFCRYRAFWIHSISFPPCTQLSSPGKTIWTLCNWSCRSDLCRWYPTADSVTLGLFFTFAFWELVEVIKLTSIRRDWHPILWKARLTFGCLFTPSEMRCTSLQWFSVLRIW